MIKTILVPTSGSTTDNPVFATALALAKPLGAHLEFLHLRLPEDVAAMRTPHLDFCVGSALPKALDSVRESVAGLSQAAVSHFETFCTQNVVPLREYPGVIDAVSASYSEERSDAREQLLMHARHSDLLVLGRASHIDFMPRLLLEDLIVGSGRPVVLAPEAPVNTVTGTIVVGWKETPEAARALGAAWPLLERAKKVILLSIVHHEARVPSSLEHLARQLEWHGVKASTRVVRNEKGAVTTQVARQAVELGADLLVIGAFGHGRLREVVFGGVTRSLLESADIPVFMMS